MSVQWWPRSLFGRIVLILAAGLIGGQLLTFAIFSREAHRVFSERDARMMARRIGEVVQVLDAVPADVRGRVVAALDGRPMRVRIGTGDGGQVMTETDPVAAAEVEAALEQELGTGRGIRVALSRSESPARPDPLRKGDAFPPPGPTFPFEVALRLSDGAQVTLTGGFPRRPPPPLALERLWIDLLVRFGVVLLIALIAVRLATRPVLALGAAAERLGHDLHRPPLPETGPVEVRQAARAFNQMQARLAEYLDSRARVLAGMSHDLKTPLTRLRLRAELIEDADVRARCVADLDELDAMVGGTIDFMRGANSQEPVREIDVMALLESLQADAQELGHAVTLEGAVRAPYPGRPQLLKRCVGNLLDNAIKYGGRSDIVVDDNDRRLVIRILDHGPGIPGPELEKVFEPFYRLDPSRYREAGVASGTGLGLGIARNIAETHGGTLRLHNRAEGGLEAVLELPRG
jgi:signal transduction histidine kinase